jgi:hypothetical protein
MLTVTISIAAILAVGTLAYFNNDYRKAAADYKAKFESTRDFAEESAKSILKSEQRAKELSNTIVMLKAEVAALQAAKVVQREASKPTVNPQITDAVTANKTNGKKRGPKPNRHNNK